MFSVIDPAICLYPQHKHGEWIAIEPWQSASEAAEAYKRGGDKLSRPQQLLKEAEARHPEWKVKRIVPTEYKHVTYGYQFGDNGGFYTTNGK